MRARFSSSFLGVAVILGVQGVQVEGARATRSIV